MNPVDQVVSWVNPQAGLRRRAARAALARYEAGEPTRLRKFYQHSGSQNEIVQRYAKPMVHQVRHLVRNHDLARGALRTLVNNVAGAGGIGIEPQPRYADGKIHEEYAADLRELYRDWCMKPEVTHTYTMARLQRAAVRCWLRDGEIFGQFVEGLRPDLDHGTRVPLSLEMFETDLVPMENDIQRSIIQGIERNTWGRKTGLYVLKSNPLTLHINYAADTKRIAWDRVIHVATLDHFGQLRGISEFASVITRLEDIKDYEESERVAAKIAAMLTAYVKKGQADMYSPDEATSEPREIDFSAAMIIDDLAPGEEIGMIDSKRPNPNLITFRQGQLRATAAGIGASYSSLSKDYGGSYAAQRQELVEQWVNYAVLVDDFTGAFMVPVWKRFVRMAEMSGAVRRPAEVVPTSADDALFVAQAMPWIDPLKEALGSEALVKAGFESEVAVIRRRGGNPRDVLEQVAAWREKCEERGVIFGTNEAALHAAMESSAGASE